ncbi:MAG: DegT/DnrJ/EryC1/StrS family aminotransferase [Kastovskya adunca ATA6-11-RM4]|jgi:dTDP-4-amino-4,6-dideoxygalactose transaminase|nr:DegT/DnrJ/EryC1/StrS family aminotransferase [Kastovskya adunca ATA6-11-RM4]
MTNAAAVKVPFVDLSLQHQPIAAEIEQAIQTTIQRGDFVLGKALSDFEAAFAQASGVQYGIGVASGTDAIALGLQACGIGAGDEVILPANTFVATLIGVLRAGATPILVDCEPETALIDLKAAHKAVNAKTKAILPVHLYGQMVSPHQLKEFAANHKLIIFEDAAQAHLAEREGYRAGSIGTAAAFSFYPSKNLGAYGDGGMIITSDPEVAKKARSIRNYGAPRKYFHSDLGTNSRLDTLQAAILNVKLPHLTSWNQQRLSAAQEYDRLLEPMRSLGIFPLQNQSSSGHIYHLYILRITANCPLSRDTLQAKLADFGIQTGIHYPLPCHLQPAYQPLGYKEGDFPVAEALTTEILSLPMYPGLSHTQVHDVVEALQAFVNTDSVAAIAG